MTPERDPRGAKIIFEGVLLGGGLALSIFTPSPLRPEVISLLRSLCDKLKKLAHSASVHIPHSR